MRKINFDKNWDFCLHQDLDMQSEFGLYKVMGGYGPCAMKLEYNNWKKVDLPHDWAISLPTSIYADKSVGGKPTSSFSRETLDGRTASENSYNVGWYRKEFFGENEWEDKRVYIEFEGVCRDYVVWVNGTYMTRHCSAYTGLVLDIRVYIKIGETNSIAVRVDVENREGWWYDGAGIYRHVNLFIAEKTHLKINKTTVKANVDGEVFVKGIVENSDRCCKNIDTLFEICDKNGNVIANTTVCQEFEPYSETEITARLKMENPILWDVENPYLYTLKITLLGDVESIRFGVREFKFDPNLGFFLNGKQVKLRGASVHQDFGGVGVALSDNIHRYKIKKLKEMGCNAYRTAHNPPSPELLNACDELGMLVMDEARTFGTSPEAIEQLVNIIERDRNHACIFMWSLGNEENEIQNTPISIAMMEKMTRIAKSLDDRYVTYGANNGPNFTGVNAVAEVRGFNYMWLQGCHDMSLGNHMVDKYHQEHPNQPLIATEEASHMISMNEYQNDMSKGKIDCFGRFVAPWGTSPERLMRFTENRPYVSGSFMWTGFDYRGESTPFGAGNTTSTFGTIDLSGREKPTFYYYQAWWSDEPVLKIAPHWNYKKGEKVTIAVMTNCEQISLFLNGNQIAEQSVKKYEQPFFTVDFEAGELVVIGTKNGNTYTDKLVTSDKTDKVTVHNIEKAYSSDDVAIYELSAVDKNDNFCPIASDRVGISAKNCEIVGVCNGNPKGLDCEQKEESEDAVYINFLSSEKGYSAIPLKACNGFTISPYIGKEEENKYGYADTAIVNTWNGNRETHTVVYNAYANNVKGYEYVEFERLGGETTVYVNGKKVGDNLSKSKYVDNSQSRPYRFYAKFREGENVIKIESVQTDRSNPPVSGYIKVGKIIKNTSFDVRLYCGKARVFVRSQTPDKVKLSVKIKK